MFEKRSIKLTENRWAKSWQTRMMGLFLMAILVTLEEIRDMMASRDDDQGEN